jgi:DNA-binding MarR family transcriptional regulator
MIELDRRDRSTLGCTTSGSMAIEGSVKDQYLQTTRLIERLHRRFLDVIKAELDRLGIEDINNVQTLILFNINQDQLTVGELTARGYYLGSNVSYNVRRLVENGYLIQERSPHDRRMTRVRLSQKALDLTSQIDQLYRRNAQEIAGRIASAEQLEGLNKVLQSLERYWSNLVSYAP